jgi:small nuclear ribonucleoprotein (snRNP)-like protein
MEEKKDMIEGMKVFVQTNSGRNYTGTFQKEDSNFIYIIDKFNEPVRISIRDINVLEGVRE